MNAVVRDRGVWYQPGVESPIVQAMNQYTESYPVYALMLLVDTEGRLVARMPAHGVSGLARDGAPGAADPPFGEVQLAEYARGRVSVSSVAHRRLVERHGVDEAQLGVMISFSDTLRGAIPGVVTQFYKDVEAASDLRAVLHEHSSIERQRPMLTRYLERLVEGEIDDEFIAIRHRVGAAHDRIDLGIPAVVAAYDAICGGFSAAVAKVATPAEARRFERAFDRISRLDIALLADGVATSRKHTVDRLMAEAEARAEEAGAFIQAVGDALNQLAAGNLTARVEGRYEGAYAELVANYHAATAELNQTLASVDQAAHEVSAASREIDGGSQSLAAAVAQTAASIEEVTHGLAQVAQVSRQNVDHAKKAGTMAREARVSVEAGQQRVNRLGEAIEAIEVSADKTSNIVHAIDEIAFQTNLLALNAAVEAARAGEAGAGFTVVAQEVRALAMRSAEAAKSTAELIDQAVGNAVRGVQISSEVLASLETIGERVKIVDSVMDQIVEDAAEQQSVITQSERALDEVNGATQRNAATTEETATAASELNGQAGSMLQLVRRFELSDGRPDTADAWRRGA